MFATSRTFRHLHAELQTGHSPRNPKSFSKNIKLITVTSRTFRHLHAETQTGHSPRNPKLFSKIKIVRDEEMQVLLHMKRKGSSMTKNDKAYRRRDKHHKPNY